MHIRKIILFTFVFFTSIVLFSNNEATSKLTIASWNIRILSDKSRDDSELKIIADILSNYDLVAIQEVRDKTVMDRLVNMLPEYDYIISDPVGNTVKERYSFIFKTSLVESRGSYLLGDPDDNFIREPFIGHFKSNNFDFTLISIHVLFGNKKERRNEITLLDDVIKLVDDANGPEDDVILLGDFNFPGNETSWEIDSHHYLISPDIKTTITDTSSYDNFWINKKTTTEVIIEDLTVFYFDEILFNNLDKEASLKVSDHRPIVLSFNNIQKDDDLAGTWNKKAMLNIPKTKLAELIPTSIQCKAITKKGTRCTRNVNEGLIYCWQHKED